jgi:hypothetical protein
MFGSPGDEGVAQRTIRGLMQRLESEDATVVVSQYEIYNEKAGSRCSGGEADDEGGRCGI